jgi:hypothetical protein
MYFLHFLGKDELFHVCDIEILLLLPLNVKNTLSLNRKMIMKRIYLSMLAVLFFGATFAQHNVTFQVDLGSATPSANGVHVAGSFQNPAWTPDATQMTQVGSSSYLSKLLYQFQPVITNSNF